MLCQAPDAKVSASSNKRARVPGSLIWGDSRGLSALLAPLLTGPEIRGIIDAMREKICLPCTDDFWFDAISLDPVPGPLFMCY